MGEHGQCPMGRLGRGRGPPHAQALAALWLSMLRGSFAAPDPGFHYQITHHHERVKIRNRAHEETRFILVSG
jgi:hypothetical protein